MDNTRALSVGQWVYEQLAVLFLHLLFSVAPITNYTIATGDGSGDFDGAIILYSTCTCIVSSAYICVHACNVDNVD